MLLLHVLVCALKKSVKTFAFLNYKNKIHFFENLRSQISFRLQDVKTITIYDFIYHMDTYRQIDRNIPGKILSRLLCTV